MWRFSHNVKTQTKKLSKIFGPGIIAVPLLIVVIKVANDKKILHKHTNRRLSNVLGWFTVAIMGFSIVIMIFTWGY